MRNILFVASFALAVVNSAQAQQPLGSNPALKKTIVTFPSHGRVLKGYLYVPAGKGPFPAVLWNHGSEAKPTDQPDLADHYTRAGYVFFVPHRRGQGLSPGPYIMDQLNAFDAAHGDDYRAIGENSVKLLEEQNADVVAALDWLKKQPFVDTSRIFMSGCSFGGIQTMLSAEKGLGLKGAISFAPGAMSWELTQIADRLVEAAHNAKVPVFVIQAHNDFSLQPCEILGPIVAMHNARNGAKIYPDFGAPDDHRSGHGRFAIRAGGIQIWGADVNAFMRECLESKQ